MQESRPAGFNERRCIARDTLGLYGSIVTVGTYEVPKAVPKATDAKSQIITAVSACVAEHAALSVIVEDAESESPLLKQTANFDVSEHIEFLESDEALDQADLTVQRLLQRAQNNPHIHYGSRPQWRVYVQQVASHTDSSRFNIAFSCSHVLADGMSTTVFHLTLLRALQTGTSISNNPSTLANFDLLPPAIEHAAALPISWGYFASVLASEFLPSWAVRALSGAQVPNTTGAWIGAAQRPSLALPRNPERLITTEVRLLRVPAPLLRGVLAACKRRGARLTGLLDRLIARALHRALRKEVGGEASGVARRFACVTPYDLRRCVPEARGRMANYASGMTEVIEVGGEEGEGNAEAEVGEADWRDAKRVTERLAEKSGTLRDQVVALLKYVSKYRVWVMEKASKPSDVSFELSNLGVIQPGLPNGSERTAAGGSPDGWDLKDFVFSQSADATGPPLGFNVASAQGGALAITAVWWPGMLGVSNEESFVQDVLENIQKMLVMIGQKQ